MKSIFKGAALGGLIGLGFGSMVAAEVMTDGQGMTLYSFDNDQGGVSACYDGCAAKWPPMLGAEGEAMPKGWALVARTDGAMQWAFKGMPLYYFKGDRKAGDAKGEGMGGVWHTLAK